MYCEIKNETYWAWSSRKASLDCMPQYKFKTSEQLNNKVLSIPRIETAKIREAEVAKQANVTQRKWMDDITDYVNENGLGDLYGHEYEGRTDIQRHHVLGRAAKHNKIDIGHWFIIPVPFELHDPNMKHPQHVGHCKKSFIKKFGSQRGIYEHLTTLMLCQGYAVPPINAHYAILETNA